MYSNGTDNSSCSIGFTVVSEERVERASWYSPDDTDVPDEDGFEMRIDEDDDMLLVGKNEVSVFGWLDDKGVDIVGTLM